ncbi:hypothetical protein [Halobaculum lipolyticum]|uniref:Uncharacterized protein n=1 Tax=Halobaculum lipolyticum TaxID=3032001 RepID=A0ABD5WCZ2_9EURY|nr:hypothetical protein [Halobaculum sp. DT31]
MTGGTDSADVAAAFGARVDVTRPAHGTGFFVVTPARGNREDDESRAAFERVLLRAVGGRDAVFLAEGDVYLVHTGFATAESLRERPEVAHVGGVSVDMDRLRSALGV